MKLVRLIFTAACVVLAVGAVPAWDRNAASAAAPAVTKARPSLTPHKATYELSLLRAAPGDGVRAARGTMVYTLADRCDGYTIESSVAMNLSYAGGNDQKVDQRYAAWEAKSGRFSSFTMQTLENNEPAKTYRGTITLDADGSGTATYEADKTTKFELAPGTMLSTAHTVALLENAAAGKKFFSREVIDGSFDQGPFLVTALIPTSREGRAAQDKESLGAMTGGRFWPMSLAYFSTSAKTTTPEYELGMELLPSGISRSMTQDFGTFSIGFRLVEIEQLKPEC